MLHTGAGIGAVVLENRDVVHPVVHAERVVALLIDAQDVRHMRIGQQAHVTGMVGTVDNDLMKTEPLDAAPQMLQAARGLDVTRQSGKLVGNHAHRPGLAVRGVAQHLAWRFAFVPRTEWTTFQKRREGLHRAMHCQVLRPLRALGGDDDPFLGKEILAKFRHPSPLSSLSAEEGQHCSAGTEGESAFRRVL